MLATLARQLAQPPAAPAPAPPGAAAVATRAHRLADGTAITVRPIRADDAPLEADLVRRLSDESRYKRFMGSMRELPASKLRYLTEVDNVHHVALVAAVEREGHEVLLGAARYVVEPGDTTCEFAVAVDDAWQGSGVAGVLMHALMDIARSRGLARMDGIVLATNRRMLKFARQLGFSVQRDPDDARTMLATRTL
jgi:acetyltransferase